MALKNNRRSFPREATKADKSKTLIENLTTSISRSHGFIDLKVDKSLQFQPKY